MTKFQRRALGIIRNAPGISAAQFARTMWPHSRMHEKHGPAKGKGAWLCAGSHISKLVRKGWIFREGGGYHLSPTGYRLLQGGA